MSDEVPDVLLERHRLGELPPAEAEALARRIGADEALRTRLQALQESDDEIQSRHPAEELAAQIRARAGASRPAAPSTRVRYWPLPAALAAAAALAFTVLVPRAQAPGPVQDVDRVKGLKPSLAVFRKTADHSEALADGDRARAGDLIRLGYRAAGRRFGAILSLDGRGHVTLHLPREGGRAVPLQVGEVVLLDHAFELDDAPRWERFFFVTSEAPFDVSAVVDGARHAPLGAAPPAALDLPPPLEQSAFSLEKEARP